MKLFCNSCQRILSRKEYKIKNIPIKINMTDKIVFQKYTCKHCGSTDVEKIFEAGSKIKR